jgi:hypothetical protein
VAAGFIAGSIPMNGILYFALNSCMAFVVAVLQATTINLQSIFNNSSVFLIHNAMISSFDF